MMYNSISQRKIISLSEEKLYVLHLSMTKTIWSFHSKGENLNFVLNQLPLKCTINFLTEVTFSSNLLFFNLVDVCKIDFNIFHQLLWKPSKRSLHQNSMLVYYFSPWAYVSQLNLGLVTVAVENSCINCELPPNTIFSIQN